MTEQKQLNEEKPTFSVEFYEEEIQSFAEANFDRELTDLELSRMEQWYEDDGASCARTELLISVIKMVIDPDIEWGDEDYQPAQVEGKNKN